MNIKIDISAIVEGTPLGVFQTLVFAQCFLCMVVDGFDIQAMSYAAPSIIAQWGISGASLGPVFSASLLGMLIGSLAFGSVADRIGRRPVLLMATTALSIMMFFTARSTGVTELLVLRILTGIAMGAIVPNVAALSTEYAPRYNRVMLLMLVASGMLVGGITGGAIAAALIPHYGWQAVFYVGSIAPLCLTILMYFALPESLQWCVLRNRHLDRVRRTLTKIQPGFNPDPSNTMVVAEQPRKGRRLPQLFTEGRLVGTLLLWLINFMNMLCVYFLASWTPVLMSGAGHNPSQAVLAGTSMWVGGLVGSWLLGWFVDPRGFAAVLVPAFTLAAFAIVFFSRCYGSINLAYLALALIGFGILGGQSAVNAMAATFYPTALRGTGAGWAMGLGRLGGICGPFIGATLMQLQWSTTDLLVITVVPASITVLALLGFWKLHKVPAQPATI